MDIVAMAAAVNATKKWAKDEINEKISSVYRYKGTVQSYADLPSENLVVGDVYNIIESNDFYEIKAGDNVAWTGSEWDILGGRTLSTDKLIPLALNTNYQELQIRTDWEQVPVYITSNSEKVAELSNDNNNDLILLQYLIDENGMPVPALQINNSDGAFICFSNSFLKNGATMQKGWHNVNSSEYIGLIAPLINNMTFTTLKIYNNYDENGIENFDSFNSLTSLPDKAKSALDTLSRMVNVSMDAMGDLGIKPDGVQRLQNIMKVNIIQHFATSKDIVIALPTIPAWTKEDLQMVLYLDCDADIDVTFPVDTEFIGDLPNTNTGLHKLIFIRYRDSSVWSVGSIDTEVA